MKEKKSILSALILLMLVIPIFAASFVNNNGIYAADTKIEAKTDIQRAFVDSDKG